MTNKKTLPVLDTTTLAQVTGAEGQQRSQMFQMLASIMEKYDKSAKKVIEGLQR